MNKSKKKKKKKRYTDSFTGESTGFALHTFIKSIMSAQYLQHKGLKSENNLALNVLIIVRHRVLKSGPAEEIIECRRHERGRAREGDPPLSLGGLPRENFEFLALLCAFLMGLGTRFQSRFFARKDIS